MSSFYGFGTTFYGKKYFNPIDKSYITIKWVIFGLLPIIPLKAYRIIKGETKGSISIVLSATTHYKILGEVPLKANFDLVLSTYLMVYGGFISILMGFKYPVFFLILIALAIKLFISKIKKR